MQRQGEGKRVFGIFEVVFDLLYLAFALGLGICCLTAAANGPQRLCGAMALVLAGGDAFHLAPRIAAVLHHREEQLAWQLGFGKLVASLTMTVFYLMLWHMGLFYQTAPAWATAAVYLLGGLRMGICLFPQNRWFEKSPPMSFAVLRNIPFVLMGAAVAALYALAENGPGPMAAAIALSFAFYLPVALWAGKNRKLGMLMLPKTLAYVWMLVMLARAAF